MKQSSPKEVSLLLHAWSAGGPAALNRLMPLVQQELWRIAHRYMSRERAHHSLQATALVNKAYIRLLGAGQVDWQDRAHFFAIAANVMRRILVDFARSSGYRKRGSDLKAISFDEALLVSADLDPGLVKLDEALKALAEFDSRKAKGVEQRFYGGLDLDETAEVLKVSRDTVKRDWRLARVWIYCEMLPIMRK